jgi:hypothetical protein
MKQKLFSTLLVLSLLFVFENNYAAVAPSSAILPASNSSSVKPGNPFKNFTVEQFLQLTPKKYKEITGKRMSLTQKLSLKYAQHKVKKMMKKGKTIDMAAFTKELDTSDFNIGGFVLGLLLGPIGILIAYLIDDPLVIKWAWIGGIIWLGIVLLSLLL